MATKHIKAAGARKHSNECFCVFCLLVSTFGHMTLVHKQDGISKIASLPPYGVVTQPKEHRTSKYGVRVRGRRHIHKFPA